MHREVSVIVLGLEKLYGGWEKGLSHRHRLSSSWPASCHVITRTNPKRQSHPLHWSDSATLCRGLPGHVLAGPGACRGPGLAGCKALPARVLPGLRNPLIFCLLDYCLDASPRQGLPGVLACRGNLLPASAAFVL